MQNYIFCRFLANYAPEFYDCLLKMPVIPEKQRTYIAPKDIHVYSIDEVFMDVTVYLGGYKTTVSTSRLTAHELAMKMS